MPEPCAELVFVAGPQKGQRAAILGNKALAGRSAKADIPLEEQTCSRSQMTVTRYKSGWGLTNHSTNGTVVNGKRIKAEKSVRINTGDVIEVGAETRMLFVAPGDDADKALAAYRRTLSEQEAADLGPEGPVLMGAKPFQQVDQQDDAGDAEAAAAASKKKKYLIFFGIYALGMVVLIAVLMSLGDGGPVATDAPKSLEERDFTEAVESTLPRKSPGDDARAEQLANEAELVFYPLANEGGQWLFRTVNNFKQHSAYRVESRLTDRQDKIFTEARLRLQERTWKMYLDGYKQQQRGNWRGALDIYNELLDVFPAGRYDTTVTEEEKKLYERILDHVGYVRKQSDKERKKEF